MKSLFVAALVGAVCARRHFNIKDKIDKALDFIDKRSEKVDKIISIIEESVEDVKNEWNLNLEATPEVAVGKVENGMVFTQKDDQSYFILD